MSEPGRLLVIATPIGNLEDVTLRALRVLREVSFVACEDTRTTRKLCLRHGITARLVSCHEHNETRRAREIVAALGRGERVALVTDAGTPGVSDPGRRVVAAVLEAGFRVEPVPGPSAVLAALVASGMNAERFSFVGFLPRRGKERARELSRVLATEGAVVLYEAPHRLARTLGDLAQLAPTRRASLHRELTKLYEESRPGTLSELQAWAEAAPPRGEFTLVVAGAEPPARSGRLTNAVRNARARVAAGAAPSEAARQAALAEGVPRRRIYRRLVGADSEE